MRRERTDKVRDRRCGDRQGTNAAGPSPDKRRPSVDVGDFGAAGARIAAVLWHDARYSVRAG